MTNKPAWMAHNERTDAQVREMRRFNSDPANRRSLTVKELHAEIAAKHGECWDDGQRRWIPITNGVRACYCAACR